MVIPQLLVAQGPGTVPNDAQGMQVLFGQLGVAAPAATFIVNVQGINNMVSLARLSDHLVETLVKSSKNPGGGVQGVNIPHDAEQNIKLAAYYLRFCQRVQRPTHPGEVMLGVIMPYEDFKVTEASYSKPETPELNMKDMEFTLDVIREYLSQVQGIKKAPLSYVVRTNIVPEERPAEEYGSLKEELIAQSPIRIGGQNTDWFVQDNEQVWIILRDMCQNHECWVYISNCRDSKNGRKAFRQLEEHYLGPNNVNVQAAKAEAKLASAYYTKETRNYGFERFVAIHTDCHARLERLRPLGYLGMDDRSKVRHLLQGIRSIDPMIAAVKTRILSEPDLQTNFARCVNLFQDAIAMKARMHPREGGVSVSALSADISAMQIDDDDTKPDMGVELRYYNSKEYSKLTPAQRKGLRLKRIQRGDKPKGGKKPGKTAKKGRSPLNKKQFKNLKKRVIKAVRAEQKKQPGNGRGNKDLSRDNDSVSSDSSVASQ